MKFGHFIPRIPPTQLVDRSYSAYRTTRGRPVPNPTNAVGGSFILSLQDDSRGPRSKSHQRSWWIVHTQPTGRLAGARSQIPPTQLVDRSYSAYRTTRGGPVPNPTNAVGGSFILSLQDDSRAPGPKSHQRSWWIVHTQPTGRLAGAPFQIPPTQLVDRSYSAYRTTRGRPVPNPTNAVGGSFILSLQDDSRGPRSKSHQ